jgi:hypothetical protein
MIKMLMLIMMFDNDDDNNNYYYDDDGCLLSCPGWRMLVLIHTCRKA